MGRRPFAAHQEAKKQSARGLPLRRRLTPNHHPSLKSNVRCRGVSNDEPTATWRRTPR